MNHQNPECGNLVPPAQPLLSVKSLSRKINSNSLDSRSLKPWRTWNPSRPSDLYPGAVHLKPSCQNNARVQDLTAQDRSAPDLTSVFRDCSIPVCNNLHYNITRPYKDNRQAKEEVCCTNRLPSTKCFARYCATASFATRINAGTQEVSVVGLPHLQPSRISIASTLHLFHT